jgi:nicotinate-nucleotide pyrophosphorylase
MASPVLDPSLYRDLVRRALEEDIRDGDVTTEATVAPALRARGVFLAKADCVIAGIDVSLEAFRQLEVGVRADVLVGDGSACRAGDHIAEIVGAARTLLVGERTALNFLREAVARAHGRARIEISGGVTLDRIPELAATGADFVSVGALTHSAPAIDISFEIEPF